MDDARRRDAGEPPGDRVPESDDARVELVDETIDGSFPASDPPSTWARETAEDAGTQNDDRAGIDEAGG